MVFRCVFVDPTRSSMLELNSSHDKHILMNNNNNNDDDEDEDNDAYIAYESSIPTVY